MLEAVFTDLDGTLLNSRGEVGAEDFAAVARLQRAGVRVYFATGRHPCLCQSFARRLGVERFVACNGSLIWDAREDRALDMIPFETELLRRLFAFLDAPGLYYSVQTEVRPYFDRRDPRLDLAAHAFYMRSGHSAFTGFGLRQELPFPPPEAVVKIGASGLSPRQLEQLKTQFPDCGIAPYPESGFAEISPGLCSKWYGIQWLAQTDGFDLGGVLALGDSANDLPMLRCAAYSAAPANAAPSAAAAAAFLTADHDHNPLAAAVAHFCPELA